MNKYVLYRCFHFQIKKKKNYNFLVNLKKGDLKKN